MKQCKVCGKNYFLGGTRKLLRGHYNPTKTSRKQSNLQWTSMPGQPGRFKACVKCIRKLKESAKKSTQN